MHDLFAHQRLASDVLDEVDSLALFYEAGTGKTMCVLDWVERHTEDGDLPPRSVLVICPASVIPMWERAISNLSMFGHSGETIENVRRAVVITSFGRLYTTEGSRREKDIRHVLKPEYLRTWGLIAVDESHGIGAHESVQTEMCLTLAQYAAKRVILTGTPISGGGGAGDYKKLYGQMLFLDYGAFDGMKGKKHPWCTWTQWKNRYVTSMDFFGKPTAYDEAALIAVMKRFALVARLDDCYDMPPSEDIDIPLELSGKAGRYYNKLASFDPALDTGLEVELTTGGSRYVKMYEITSGFVKRTSDDEDPAVFPTPRTDALETIIGGTDDKAVVFCHFIHSVEEAAEVCRAHGETVVMDGRSDKDAWIRFQDGPARYIVCQYQSGGVGIDLFASHTCIFYEPTMSSLLLEQARARIRRKGQTKRCLYYHLICPGLVDDRISGTVRSGADVTNAMLDEWDRE